MVNPLRQFAPFDPAKGFAAPKNMRFAGRAYLKGEQLDTSGVSERKLRELYQLRVIDQRDPEAEPAQLPEPLSEADQARADRLVASHNRKALDQLGKAAGVDSPSSFGNKDALAEAIVRKDPNAGLPPADEDEGQAGEIVVGSKVTVDQEGHEHHGKSGEVASLGAEPGTAAVRLDGEGDALFAIPLESLKLPEPAQKPE